VYGDDPPSDDELRAAVHTGRERTPDQDVGFGLRQLVDVAERALSPSMNDPTTAVQAIDQLHDLLRRLATRPLQRRQRLTGDGRVAVDIPQPQFSDYLHLAVDEIAHWGADHSRIQRPLGVMLHDLKRVARPEHQTALTRMLERFDDDLTPSSAVALPPSDTGLR